MTVIVASVKEGLMASDSLGIDNDGETWFPSSKIWRVRDTLVGFAGDTADAPALIAWLRKPEHHRGEAPGVSHDDGLLILSRDKLQTWTPHDGFFTVERDWHAIGSGGSHAQVAMLAGASVKRAAQLVIKVVATCGGQVVTRQLRRTA